MVMKKVFWSLAVFMSFLMLNACEDPSSSSPNSWADSTWEYEGPEEDTITLGENTLTYNSKEKKEPETLTVLISEDGGPKAEETVGMVSPDERILAWIYDDGGSDILAIIYNPIKLIPNSVPPDYIDDGPEKLKIINDDLYIDLQVKPPYIYIKK
jgi:hypothetical protein